MLEVALQAGLQVRRLVPYRKPLEEVFVASLKAAMAQNGTRSDETSTEAGAE